jgi:hypothetical protein
MKNFSVPCPKPFGHEINVNIELRKRGAQHLPVGAVKCSSFCIESYIPAMHTVTHATPIVSLESLNVNCPPKNKATEYYDANKTQVNTPQYVTSYFQCTALLVFVFPPGADC